MNGSAEQRPYAGTLVGESTSREFRLALAADAVREQDIIAVDADLRAQDGSPEPVRVWAKVQQIERLNPLFPAEAGHELAATQTDPFDTVLSLSREMVTAVCRVLGYEPRQSVEGGGLRPLRYPAQPASSAYSPRSADIKRIVLGDLSQQQARALDVATLSNRPDVDVFVDGHAIVTRHLAVLAMTGAGKSWAVRRIIEQLANRHYPIVIFDPHGDYTGLADLDGLTAEVRRFYAHLPVLDEDTETVARIVDTLGYELTPAMRERLDGVVRAARRFYDPTAADWQARVTWLRASLGGDPRRDGFPLEPNLWLVADLTELAELALRRDDRETIERLENWGWQGLPQYSRRDAMTLEGIKKRLRSAAKALQQMERTNRRVARDASPLPQDRGELVCYNGISVVSLAGYTGEFQATIYSIIAEAIFEQKVSGHLRLPVLFVLEEAHTFAPAHATGPAQQRAIATTKQIAQEGRKFGAGLVLVSQRPSRLDETTLSQCNSQLIMRMVNPADQQFVRRVIESLGDDDARMLPDLETGEALLSGQITSFPVLVKMKPPASRGTHEEEDAFEALERARATQTGAASRPASARR